MIDVMSFFIVVCAFILGLATHSAYVHSKQRGGLPEFPWDHYEIDDLEDDG